MELSLIAIDRYRHFLLPAIGYYLELQIPVSKALNFKCIHIYFQILYSEFLRTLRCKSKLLATCLAAGDKLGLSNMSDIVSTIFSGLYGSCLMQDDEQIVLR
jgi:hypothetical protein